MEAKFHESKNKASKILAFADVSLTGGVTVKGFRVVNGEKGLFAAVPSRPVNVDGETRYINQVDFDSDTIREQFLTKLLDDYKAWTSARQPAGETNAT
jgi:DNA-binding cell septation regulator SpoVG